MNTNVSRLIASKFVVWMLAAAVGSYFLVSIKAPEHGQSRYSSLMNGDFKTFFKSLYMPRIKLGIDLQGGTYFVLSVGVEKAIENKLGRDQRELESLFKKELKKSPAKAVLAKGKLTYAFDSEEAASACYYLIKKNNAYSVAQSDMSVVIGLNAADEQRMRQSVVDQAVSVLTNRLNGFGVSGLIVQRHGEHQIVVQLPGVSDPARVKALITQTAMLEFKIVEKVAHSKDALLDEFDGDLPSDKMVVPGRHGDEGAWYLVPAYPDVTGDHIVDARVGYNEMGRMKVDFSLDGSGATQFKRLTGDNIGRQLGVVIDNVMYTAPVIEAAIGSGGYITGQYSAEEARDLALVLRSGSLMAPLSFEQESRVGASLGQDSIERGLLACLIGLLLVLLFSVFYYRILGVLATMALAYNLFLIMLFLSYFESTLTLPGIAGMVLTIGMAIDSSILIYEGIREDLKHGVSFRQAVESGFKGATTVILDSNITTFLGGLILFKFGGPAVKGFAVTLMAGILATLIAGIFFLHAAVTWVTDLRSGKNINF
ncbi:MAG: preprotein translocase subunit SecD [Candidatus Dependentiae bacterium]|nr:preprotein translocase subunit SecD [Candidatus Dependentiae bacterium]